MNILIAYATFSSGTETAAMLIAKALTEKGHAVELKRIRDVDPSEFEDRDLIIMGTPSWLVRKKDGQPHDDYFAFFEKYPKVNFSGKKIALYGLGDKTYPVWCGGVHVLSGFIKEHGGEVLSDQLRIHAFYFTQSENEAKILGWLDLITT